MNTVQLPDESQLKRVILHYKKFYLSVGIILVCIALVIWVIIPEIGQYGDQKAQLEEVQGRITTLKSNIDLLTKTSDDQQAKELEVSLKALPSDKDYAGILLAIRSASTKTGVDMGDFSFNVGELSAKSVITKGLPYVSIKLILRGDPVQISKFLTELSKTSPISNISEIKMSGDTMTVTIQFYYKPIPPLKVSYTQPLVPLEKSSSALMQELRTWSTIDTTDDFLQSTIGTSSAGTVFGQ